MARHPGHLLEERRAAEGGRPAGTKRPGAVHAPDCPAGRQGVLRSRARYQTGKHAGADTDLREFSFEACDYFERWVEAIAAGDESAFGPAVVARPADALRLERRRLPIGDDSAAAATAAPATAQATDVLHLRVPDLPSASDLDLSDDVTADIPVGEAEVDLTFDVDAAELSVPIPVPAASDTEWTDLDVLPAIAELSGALTIDGDQRTQAAFIHQRNRLFIAAYFHNSDGRAKRFFRHNTHRVIDVYQQLRC